jgi:hypothetical protein
MNKIPTMYKRDPDDRKHVLAEIHPDCLWVADGEGVATRKYGRHLGHEGREGLLVGPT